jgi:hypothetical protein
LDNAYKVWYTTYKANGNTCFSILPVIQLPWLLTFLMSFSHCYIFFIKFGKIYLTTLHFKNPSWRLWNLTNAAHSKSG